MDKFVQTELEGAGVNVEETLRRFMNNEMLMIKFLRKFVDDENRINCVHSSLINIIMRYCL